MKKKLLFVAIMVFGCMLTGFAQEKSVDALINNFESDDWPTVLNAKEKLENMEGISIPGLVGLLDVESTVKLNNTGDLIYPGAEKFYIRGQMIEYDIDKIAVRAGWLLEELAFQNFGFSGASNHEGRLNTFIKLNFPDYYSKSGNKEKLYECSVAEKRKLIIDLSVKEAGEWWDKESGSWSRLDALVDALKSDDEKRQVKALFYLRNGKTKCTGLTKEYYLDNIHSIILELSKVETKRVSEHAKLILLDASYEWLKIKQI